MRMRNIRKAPIRQWNPCKPGNPEYNEVMCSIYNKYKQTRVKEQSQMGSYDRYMANQVGQSPEDYQGATSGDLLVMGDEIVMGQDTQDPCDQSSAYYDPNTCYSYGGQPYDSGQGGGGYGSVPQDAAVCDSLVQTPLYPWAPLIFYMKQLNKVGELYNKINSFMVRYPVSTPAGTFQVPFRTVQVSDTADPFQDFYTDENHNILVFADNQSPEWINAGLDQYCPSYAGGPTGQCQDIPGYQCQMSGEAIVMGEDFVLGTAAPVVRHLAAKSKQAAAASGALPKGKVVWRKMTPSEIMQQMNRYRAGGTSRSPQNKVPLSARAKSALISALKNTRAKASYSRSATVLQNLKPGKALASRAMRGARR